MTAFFVLSGQLSAIIVVIKEKSIPKRYLSEFIRNKLL